MIFVTLTRVAIHGIFSKVMIRSGRTTQRVVAGFMALWLSGFVFLFCCQNMKAAEMEAESCPLMKMSSHCDRASQQEAATDSLAGSRPACVECCAFLPVVFDKSRKVDLVQKQIAPPADKPAPEPFRVPVSATPSTPELSFADRVPDRHGTYLVNRVFRI